MRARPIRFFLLTLVVASGCVPVRTAPAAPPMHWWKGSLHAHTLWSEGDDFPENVLAWYRANGYHFAALTDHAIMPATGRWVDVTGDTLRQRALARYRDLFPRTVEERQRGDTIHVRLAATSELRLRLEDPGRFLVLTGEEITQDAGGAAVHVNAWNLTETIPPEQQGSVREMVRANLRAVAAQGTAGRVTAAQLNHPNYEYSITAADLAALPELRLVEVYSGHPGANSAGDSAHASVERMWDIALTERLAQGLPPLWGTATDNAYDYHSFGPDRRNPGRGWVVVQAPALTPDAIVRAIRNGNFYASTGVELETMTRTRERVVLEIREEAGVSYTTHFIGTLRDDAAAAGAGALEGPAVVGRVLAVAHGVRPVYEMRGDELYVRARVTSTALKRNAPRAGEFEMAWTQPVVVATPPAAAGARLSVVTLNLWHDQQDWPQRLEAIVAALQTLQPDVIALQEVLQHDSLPNQAMTLARRLGYDWYFTSVDSAQRVRRFGNAILTRHPVLVRDWVALEPLDDYRNAAYVRIAVAGREVDVYATHLHHTPEGDSIRAAQIAHLQRFIARTRGGGPLVVAGDFNAPVIAPSLQPLRASLTDVYGALHADADSVSTLVTALGHRPVRIDHVFVERASLEPVDARLILDEPVDGRWPSDHVGVLVRLRFVDETPK